MKYQFSEKYNTKKKEKNYYRKKIITGTKETQIIKNYLIPMLIYKINKKHWKKNLKHNKKKIE